MASSPQRSTSRTAEVSRPAAPRASTKSVVREYAEALSVAILLALVIRTFVVQAFKIPSGSMEPTLLIGDHILVNKFIYGVRIPFLGARSSAVDAAAARGCDRLHLPEDNVARTSSSASSAWPGTRSRCATSRST